MAHGNPEHKRNPGDFGLTPPSQPRVDKTLCDAVKIFTKAEATALLREGVRKGLISVRRANHLPQNIWSVTKDGYPIEAQLENPEQGTYHGYPMPESDPFRAEVLVNRGTRCGIMSPYSPNPMSGNFIISFNWLPREYGNIIERLTFADLFISVDSYCLTELADQLAKTVRRGPRVSLYLLAQWFVANWWRLRWEPERPKELSWLMSHKIGAAGSGYCWPDLSFCSDGWAVTIHSQPTQALESQMVRYLQSVDINIPVIEFEQEVDSFVDAMINRLASEAPAETELASLWKEVLQERRDPQLTEWRKLEAFLGYDPDEAPGKVVEALIGSKKFYGAGAIEEMAVASMDKALSDIESLWNDARPAALQITVPNSTVLRNRIQKDVQPSPFSWQRAKEAAKIARMAWSIKPGPISNKEFFEILELNAGTIDNMNFFSTPVTAGFRENACMDSVKVLVNKRTISGQRFALARLLADHLNTDQSERLLPACDTATQRQKFQRAFAQEFLCPFEDMIYFGGSKFNDEAIEALADQFIVSPLLIRTTLVNNGVLERAYL